MLLHLLIIIATIAGLWYGAVWVVDSASRIAKKMGMSDLIIGLTVVAIATSAPEFAVTISAAIKGQDAISVSNVVGSNIFNLGIILGLVVLFSPMAIEKKLVYRDGGLLLFTGFLLVLFFYDLNLSTLEGFILVSILVAYVAFLVIKKEPVEEEVPEGKFHWYDIPKLIIGVAIIITSAHYLVEAASAIARHFGVSEWLIGVTIVGAGTSTPELATSLVAVIKGKHELSAGNLIGSDLFNMLGVLGIAAIIRPLNITIGDYSSLLILAGSLIIILFMMRTGWKLTRTEGGILIAIALIRWAVDFLI